MAVWDVTHWIRMCSWPVRPGRIGNIAVSRVDGESPALYLYTSVVNPSAFVVPNYPDGIMRKTFGQSLTIQDQADIISFILIKRRNDARS